MKTCNRVICAILASLFVLGLLSGCNQKEEPREPVALDQLDEETIQDTMNHYEKIKADAEPIVEEYLDENGYVAPEDQETALKELGEYAQELYEKGSITDYAYEPGDTCVYMEIDGWLSVLYDLPMEEFLSGGSDKLEILTLEPNATEFYFHYTLSGMRGPDEAAALIEDSLDSFAWSGNYDDAEVTIETFRNFPQNSVIIFCGHGGYTEETGSILFTGIDGWDPATLLRYSLQLGEKAVGVNQDGEFYLTSVFFDKYVKEDAFDGSLVYLGACSSYRDPRLAQSIWDKGARAIICNTQPIWKVYNFEMIYSFFEGLTTQKSDGQYLTITEALDYAKSCNGEADPAPNGYGCEVVAFGRDDFQLRDMAAPAECEYNLASECELVVLDAKEAMCSNYTVHITGTQFVQGPLLSPESMIYEKTDVVSTMDPYMLKLEPGIYTITVTDNANPALVETFTAGVGGNDGKTTMVLYTEFSGASVSVSDAFSKSIPQGGKSANNYHIPQVDIPGDIAEWTNATIYEELYSIYEKNVVGYEDCPGVTGMAYTWAENNGVVSIVASWCYVIDKTEFAAYNISSNNGAMLPKELLLEAYGLDESEYCELVRSALQKYYENLWQAAAGSFGNMYDTQLKETISDGNVRDAVPYLDENGDLCVIARVYSLAGASYYEYLINVTGNTAPRQPEFTWEAPTEETVPQEESTVPENTGTIQTASITQAELVGKWEVDTEYTMEYNNMSMNDMFGRPYSDSMTFGEQGSFTYYITYYGGKGQYQISGDHIAYSIVTDYGQEESGEMQTQVIEGTLYLVLDSHGYTVFWKKS